MSGNHKTEARSLGEELKATRDKKSWSVDQAAHATRLRKEIILKLEQDRVDQLPNLAYARGFLRIYARELGLDVNAILRRFDGMMDVDEELTELRPETLEILPERVDLERSRFQHFGLVIIGLIVVAALVFGGLELYRIWPTVFESVHNLPEENAGAVAESKPVPAAATDKDKKDKDAKARPPKAVPVVPETVTKAEVIEKVEKAMPVEPVVKKAEPVTAVSPTMHKLQFAASKEVSVKVYGLINGQRQRFFEGIIPAGATYPNANEAWTANSFIISLSDAALVDIIFDGVGSKYPEPGPQEISVPSN